MNGPTDPALRALREAAERVRALEPSTPHGVHVHISDVLAILDDALAAAEAAPLDAFTLGMAMDMVDEDDAVLGVVGRGTKAERVITRYDQLVKLVKP